MLQIFRGDDKHSAVIWTNFPLKIDFPVCIFQARCLKADVGRPPPPSVNACDFFQSDDNLTLVAVVTCCINLWSFSIKSEKMERFPVFIYHQTLPTAAHEREAQTPVKWPFSVCWKLKIKKHSLSSKFLQWHPKDHIGRICFNFQSVRKIPVCFCFPGGKK